MCYRVWFPRRITIFIIIMSTTTTTTWADPLHCQTIPVTTTYPVLPEEPPTTTTTRCFHCPPRSNHSGIFNRRCRPVVAAVEESQRGPAAAVDLSLSTTINHILLLLRISRTISITTSPSTTATTTTAAAAIIIIIIMEEVVLRTLRFR